MQNITKLVRGKFYHIYNRGNNKENIFVQHKNYLYFLKQYSGYIYPVAETYAYCLMRNHFHLLVRLRSKQEQRDLLGLQDLIGLKPPSQHFSNFFNSYAKAINKAYNRSGSLFQEHFGRIEVDTTLYFNNLVHYIHFNPQKHGFIEDFRQYPYSSYTSFLSQKETRLMRQEVLARFNGKTGFKEFHDQLPDEEYIKELIIDDIFETDSTNQT